MNFRPRMYSIDVIKFALVIAMVIMHSMLYASTNFNNWFVILCGYIGFSNWPAAMFIALMGFLSYNSFDKYSKWRNISKGIFLLLIGFILEFLCGRESFFDPYVVTWDVLSLVGVFYIIGPFLSIGKINVISLSAILLVISIMSFTLHYLFDYSSYWGFGSFPVPKFGGLLYSPAKDYLGDYQHLSIFRNVLGVLCMGYFPLIPWIYFAILGIFLGKNVDALLVKGGRKTFSVSALILCISIVIAILNQNSAPVYTRTLQTSFFSPFSFYPLTFTSTLFATGIILCVFSLTFLFTPRTVKKTIFTNLITQVAQYQLSLYILHYILIFHTTHIISLILHKKISINVVPPNYMPIFIVFVLIILGIYLKINQTFSQKINLEYLIKKL